MTLHARTPTEPQLQRANGQIEITTKVKRDGTTGLDVLRQQGAMKAVFPRPVHRNMEAVLVNTAGGVTGGDRFQVFANAADGTKLSLTTQAAERIYGAASERPGRIHNRFVVGEEAELSWVPQETILFDNSRLKRSLHVDVAATGRFLMLEPLVFGRAASGERLKSCVLDDHVTILVAGQPAYLDRVHLTGAVSETIERATVGAAAGAMASLVLIDRNAERLLPAVRDLLPDTGGASVLSENTLVVRLLCSDSFALRRLLLPILDLLTNRAVPKNWRL